MTAAAETPIDLPIVQHTLANGLRVVANPDPLTGVARGPFPLRRRLPARGVRPDRFRPPLRDLMFCGSPARVPASTSSSCSVCGAPVNGTTSFDRTNYYETVPDEALPLALWLEADRMATLLEAVTQESLDTQREVVKEEKRQSYDNQPYGDWGFRLLPLAVRSGAPVRPPPDRSMADLDSATLDDVHAFFRRHYGPDNAVLAVAGGVAPTTCSPWRRSTSAASPRSADHPFLLIRPSLGSIRHGPRTWSPTSRVRPCPAASGGRPPNRRPRWTRRPRGDRARAAGSSSRLENALTRRTSVAATVHAGCSPTARAMWHGWCSTPHPGAEVAPAVEAADAEIAGELLTEGTEAIEAATAKAQIESGQLRRLGTCAGRADELAKLALHPGDPPLSTDGSTTSLRSARQTSTGLPARGWRRLRPADLTYRPESSAPTVDRSSVD